ncbi:hypothetical protein ACFXO9_28135 [Nocardia tengchongensis]|uniref:hypothetical protein n=1 Tax=Nocardia tengchongensis TaxID=2055889 RepID=UPI0036A3E4C1
MTRSATATSAGGAVPSTWSSEGVMTASARLLTVIAINPLTRSSVASVKTTILTSE